MSKPHIHAQSSARRFGGKMEDYESIHRAFDSSKEGMSDSRHRAIFHHSTGIFFMEKLFGVDFNAIENLRAKYNLPESFKQDAIQFLNDCRNNGTCIENSDGKKVSVRDIGEQHVSEDFRGRFIPSAQDYLAEMEIKDWMNNGAGVPPSFEKIERKKTTTIRKISYD